MSWLLDHKYWFLGGAVILGGVHFLKNSVGGASSQPTDASSTIISSGQGVAGTLAANPTSAPSTDLTQVFSSMIEQAKQSAMVSQTAALTTTSVDTLKTALANVGNGQKIEATYNSTGQLATFQKTVADAKPLTALQSAVSDTQVYAEKIRANAVAAASGAAAPYPDVALAGTTAKVTGALNTVLAAVPNSAQAINAATAKADAAAAQAKAEAKAAADKAAQQAAYEKSHAQQVAAAKTANDNWLKQQADYAAQQAKTLFNVFGIAA